MSGAEWHESSAIRAVAACYIGILETKHTKHKKLRHLSRHTSVSQRSRSTATVIFVNTTTFQCKFPGDDKARATCYISYGTVSISIHRFHVASCVQLVNLVLLWHGGYDGINVARSQLQKIRVFVRITAEAWCSAFIRQSTHLRSFRFANANKYLHHVNSNWSNSAFIDRLSDRVRSFSVTAFKYATQA